MKRFFPYRLATAFVNVAASVLPLCARAADSSAPAASPDAAQPAIHLIPVPLDVSGASPWHLNPAWVGLLALGLPAALWAVLAWKRVLDEDPHRLRRAGSRELRRLLARVQGSGGSPRPADLHAWFQAAARTWGVQVSTPTGNEVGRSVQALGGDAATEARWRDLWKHTERSLYAQDTTTPDDWTQQSSAIAGQVNIPRRRNWLPNRLRHWLPQTAAALCICAVLAGGAQLSHAAATAPDSAAEPLLGSADAQSPVPGLDRKIALALKAAQEPANQALHADWNNWAAHYNIAAQQMVQGNVDYAVAHLTAAFLQHPWSQPVRDNLRWSLQEAGAGTMDPTLRRFLYGAWFQSYPSLLSPVAWERLALLSALLLGGGLCSLVMSLYSTGHQRELQQYGRWIAAAGAVPLLVSLMAWHAWGGLGRPNAVMLVQGMSLTAIPTDLVTSQEAISVTPGTVALEDATILTWKQVRTVGVPGAVSGWTRASDAMPLYATR